MEGNNALCQWGINPELDSHSRLVVVPLGICIVNEGRLSLFILSCLCAD